MLHTKLKIWMRKRAFHQAQWSLWHLIWKKMSFILDRIPSLFSRKNCSFPSSKGQFYDGEVKRWKKFDFTEEELQEIERIWKMRLMSKNGCGISNDQVQKGKGGMKIAWVNWGVNFITDLRVSSFEKKWAVLIVVGSLDGNGELRVVLESK